ncbi:MAG: hypothetical protein JW910_22740, partial [Anaerolineae bacterium]|nr:hypothetical protein [Anaerolineae bacterium]
MLLLRGQFVLLLPILPLALLILSAAAVGRSAPLPVANLITLECEQPCWQGLQPGNVDSTEALAVVRARGLADAAVVVPDTPSGTSYSFKTREAPTYQATLRFSIGELSRIDLVPQEPVTLGDVFTAFGPPSHAFLCQTGSFYGGSVSAMLYYFEGTVEVWAYRLLPNLAVQSTQSPGMTTLLTDPLQ